MPKLLLILIAILVILADQISKSLAVTLDLPYSLNTGAAFGLFGGNIILLVIISLSLLSFLFLKFRFQDYLSILGVALILGGGVSNLFDRMHSGFVIDFIDPRIWPAFNLADAAVVAGVLVLLSQFVFPRKVS